MTMYKKSTKVFLILLHFIFVNDGHIDELNKLNRYGWINETN